MTGLRERKKLQTRQEIADAAHRLFRARGFDRVTIEEVAEAAGVSKKTVFNYFPAKEDLVFHRVETRRAEIVAAVRERPPGTTVVDSFRAEAHAFCDRLAGEPFPFTGGGFYPLMEASAVLTRRWFQMNNQYTELLTAELAAEAGVEPDDPVANAVASALFGAERAVVSWGRRRLRGGEEPTALAARLRVEVDRIFDLFTTGIADYPAPRA